MCYDCMLFSLLYSLSTLGKSVFLLLLSFLVQCVLVFCMNFILFGTFGHLYRNLPPEIGVLLIHYIFHKFLPVSLSCYLSYFLFHLFIFWHLIIGIELLGIGYLYLVAAASNAQGYSCFVFYCCFQRSAVGPRQVSTHCSISRALVSIFYLQAC